MSNEINKKFLLRYLKGMLGILPTQLTAQESNRITLIYFVVSSFDALGIVDSIKNKQEIIDFIYSLQVLPDKDDPSKNLKYCGFRGAPLLGNKWNPNCDDCNCMEHDYSHVTNTYTALCILKILGDDLSKVNRDAISAGLKQLQKEDGSFSSIGCGSESDLRFVFSAAATCHLINDWSGFNKQKAEEFIYKCRNWDNGFGQGPGQEAHAGSTYCALSSLSLLNRLSSLPNISSLTRWLLQNQISGFHGRVGKLADTCYSWWVGASLGLLDAIKFVHNESIVSFTFQCQSKIGGFCKVPGNHPDPLHTYFSLCALSMFGFKPVNEEDDDIKLNLQPMNFALAITERAAKSKTVFDDDPK